MTDVIVAIWEQSRRTYGWRRVQAELADAYDHVANKKLVRAIMREQGISGLPKRRKGRRNMINKETSTDLVNRLFDRDGPNLLWMTDITEHLTHDPDLTEPPQTPNFITLLRPPPTHTRSHSMRGFTGHRASNCIQSHSFCSAVPDPKSPARYTAPDGCEPSRSTSHLAVWIERSRSMFVVYPLR